MVYVKFDKLISTVLQTLLAQAAELKATTSRPQPERISRHALIPSKVRDCARHDANCRERPRQEHPQGGFGVFFSRPSFGAREVLTHPVPQACYIDRRLLNLLVQHFIKLIIDNRR